MDSRPPIAEPVGAFRTFRASLLAFSATLVGLLLIPNPWLTLAGSHPALVYLFVAGVARQVLPAGWTLYSGSTTPFFEIYMVASVMLALLISSPVASYQIVKFIAPALVVRKRTLYSVVACATMPLPLGHCSASSMKKFWSFLSMWSGALRPFWTPPAFTSLSSEPSGSARSPSRCPSTSTRWSDSDCEGRSSQISRLPEFGQNY